MGATAKGVYHDLHETKYAISANGIAFFFSSEVNMRKFLERYKDNRKEFKIRMTRPQKKSFFDFTLWADVNLYMNIEKRGFRIKHNGREISWHKVHVFVSATLIGVNLQDYQEMQTPN